jgi:hypothetical protein
MSLTRNEEEKKTLNIQPIIHNPMPKTDSQVWDFELAIRIANTK